MKKLLLFLFVFISGFYSGFAQLSFSEKDIDLGTIAETYEIKGNLVVKNQSPAKVFLMRADADKGVKIYTSKKTLQPNDTCLLVISFLPESAGKFRKKISLVASDKATPYEITLAGNLNKLKTDDKTACYYFGSPKPNPVVVVTEPVVIPNTVPKRDNSNKLPDNTTANTIPVPTPTLAPKISAPVVPKTTAPVVSPTPQAYPYEFSEINYKPNNILFLVDVSSSMRDSLKLPLMKRALHTLIDAARNIDTITFVTYASKVAVIKEAISGADKAALHIVVDSLKAKGMTSGHTAILFGQQLAQKHFISGGNNQIILATDGEFKFTREDEQLWKQHQLSKKIILSTVAFGSEKPAIKNLKEIASKGGGSFIHIETRAGSEQKLLEEIRQRSRK